MFDWDRMSERNNRFIESARKSPRGLPKEHLVPGALVTISPCLATGDRSYSGDVWEILAANEASIQILKKDGKPGAFFNGPHVVNIHEHEFYGADHFFSAPQPTDDARAPREAT